MSEGAYSCGVRKDGDKLLPEACYECSAALEEKIIVIKLDGEKPLQVCVKKCPNGHAD
jgi:hypothetical protein